MSSSSEQSEIVSKIKDLEAEIQELRKEYGASTTFQGLSPCILIEKEYSNSVLISRKVLIESCHSKLAFYGRMTDAMELDATHSEIDKKTGEVVRYRSMKVLARLDHSVESTLVSDWYGIGGPDESFLGVVGVATGLKLNIL